MIDIFDDTYFMKKALIEAEEAYRLGEIPVGAIVVSENQVIGRGYNLTEQLIDVTAHAEIQAITAASNFLGAKFLTNCTLYVTLEPCQMCAGALYWSRVSRVVFAAEDIKRGYRAMGAKLHPKTQITTGVLEGEASNLLKSFFAEKRR
ncbi:tRNA(adenine34) deaminase [Mesonia hippocampi]|uniref:tRNA-specific adenosine deaminase n=1 Tax=Mesonia hippocampi TaxID=1628250 RepID=A0A840EV41_9FLAO|nr:nucleoside deaminase [Mesonia hippocampi]MBB4119336.1 tRNA(adenine34) deaminase [Mesonia hippocampi]